MLTLVGVPIAFGLLGWSEWPGAMTGGAAAGASHSLMCRSHVLVVSGHQFESTAHRESAPVVSRSDRSIGWSTATPPPDGPEGLFNDTWWVDRIKMHVEQDLSWHVTDLLRASGGPAARRDATPRPTAAQPGRATSHQSLYWST